MTETQKTRLRQIHIWTAGYPFYPDSYATPPASYIPDQSRWGSVWLWQYSDKGIVSGIEGSVDLNWISPELYALLGNSLPSPTPNTDIITNPFDGVKQIHAERYGRKIYINVIDPKKVTIEVCAEDNYPSVNCKKYGAKVAWNGDDWDRATRIIKNNPSPSLMVFPDGRIGIGNYVTTTGEMVHSSGLRYVVQNGANAIPSGGTEPKYTERHARSITGMSSSGELIHLTIDGDYPDKGATLYECGQIMLEFGAFTAFDQGGGGDSVEVLNGIVVNIPDDNVGEIHYERKVPQTILIYSKESNMATNGTAKEKLGKTITIRSSAAVRTGNSTTKRISAFATISFVKVVDDLDHSGDPAYKWFDLGNGEFANYIYPPNGLRFDIITQPVPDPGPDPDPEPTPDPVFPQSFIVTEPVSGKKALFVFDRLVE